MSFKKKKNVIIAAVCVICCFILYQLYFFFTITSETGTGGESYHKVLYSAFDASGNRVIPVLDPNSLNIEDVLHLRTAEDRFINEKGFIRGVLIINVRRYLKGRDGNFKCLNSEQTIPYGQLNDDYCDCEDGSDEPSTSACPNGTFYCDFQYLKKPLQLNHVSSGRVNDGICDCCDGTDEFNGNFKRLLSQSSRNSRHYVDKCPNTC